MIYDEDPKLYNSLFRSRLRIPSWEEKMQLDHSIDKAWFNTIGVFDHDDNVSSEGEIDGAHMSPERTQNLPIESQKLPIGTTTHQEVHKPLSPP